MIATPEELAEHPAPPLPQWITERNLLPSPEYQFQFLRQGKPGQPGVPYFVSNYGPQTWALVSPFAETCIGGSRGGGKLSPLDSRVCTPKGFVRMGDINLGDFVTDPSTGGACRVIAIHPHPEMPIWKFTFDDGASLEVGEEHLWAYRTSSHLRPGTKRSSEREFAKRELNSTPANGKWDRHRIGTTAEIKDLFEKGRKIRVPLTEPVIFTNRHRESDTHLSAYLIGLFLGDGYLKDLGITTADSETMSYLTDLGFGTQYKLGSKAVTMRAHGPLRKRLKQYFDGQAMSGCRSWEKSIPLGYKEGSLNERLEILRGLLDTDGTVDDRGRVYFCSTSLQLATDVQFIARSLGGKARLRPVHKKFTDKHGDKVSGRLAYVVRIWHPKTSSLFRLTRKIARCTDSWNGGLELSRQLVSIDYVGEKEARCITVSSPRGLYVADDFVVTHNSVGLIAWFAVGYPSLALDDPAHYMAILEPSYRGLMLRKEYQSMAEFVDEAWDFYGPLGATKKDDPVVFTFKSGAKIYTNHLGDKDAFEKYRGWGISRIGIEELTQIEEERWYKKLLGSLRAKKQVRIHGNKTFPALPSQIMATTNPDGPGSPWVKKRFIKVLNAKGEYIAWNTPMRDPISKATRIFIPMSRRENPYLRDNAEYEANLMAQDEVTRRQWMLGDWDASSGTAFLEFRAHGPQGAEETKKYPWANHVIQPIELKPWWYRFGGGDWGYEHPAVFHKCVRNEKDGRVHVYDELSLRHCSSFEMGVNLANWWLPDLEFLPDKTVTIALSPDAFSKTDASRTKAEQMAEGIKTVLGPYGAFMLRFSDEERAMMVRDPNLAHKMFDRRRGEMTRGQFCLVLKAANTNRVDGWSYIREQLRFRPIVTESQAQLKERLKKTYAQAGIEAYEKELSKVKRPEDGTLPKLQIWKHCTHVIRCLEEAIRDEDKPEDVRKTNAIEGVGGDDALDCLRMALMDFKEVEKTMPKSYYVSERMEQIQSQYEVDTGERITDPTRLIMIQQTQGARYESKHQIIHNFTPPRASSSRHRSRH